MRLRDHSCAYFFIHLEVAQRHADHATQAQVIDAAKRHLFVIAGVCDDHRAILIECLRDHGPAHLKGGPG